MFDEQQEYPSLDYLILQLKNRGYERKQGSSLLYWKFFYWITLLDNKLEETRSRMAFQHATKICNVMALAETWLGHCSRGALHSPPGPDITTFS